MEKNKYLKIGILSLFFVFAFVGYSFAQVTLSLRYSNADSRYHVYLKATQALNAIANPKLTDGSTIITVVAATGGNLTVGTVNSVSPSGSWDIATTQRNNGDLVSGNGGIAAPQNTDFFVFTPAGDFTSINYTVGQEVELFNFDVTGVCTGSLDLLPSGAQTAAGGTQNIGSYYSVRGYPGGIGANHFSATYDMAAPCPGAAAPDLITTIGQPATPFVVGQASNVPVTTTNQGSGPANGPITTTITLPTGMSAPATFTSNGNTCSTSGQTVTCTNAGPLSNVAPNNSTTIQVPMTPNASVAGTTPTTNATSSAPNEPAGNTTNNNATPMVPGTAVTGVPDLVTTIGQPATPFTVGQASNVPVTTTNQGSGPANGPIMTTITLPTGMSAPATFTSNGNTCSTSGQTVTCTNAGPLSNVAPNNSTTIQVPMTPNASVAGTTPTTNATSSAPNEPAGNTTNNNATPMVPSAPVTGVPDLVTTIGQPATPFVVGQASNVPVTTTNQGSGLANGPITTTITLPTGMSAPATFTSNGNTCSTSGQTVTCTNAGPLSNVAPNNSTTIQVPMTPDASVAGTTPATNATSSAPNEPAGNTTNNNATPMVPGAPVTGVPDLVTTIGQPSPSLVAGTASNVPVTVTNIGSAPANGPIVTTITLPANTSAPATFSSNGNTCSTSGQTVTCTNAGPLSNVAPNNSTTIQVPVTATNATVGTNPGPFTATPSAPNEPAGNTGNNGATPMTPSTPVASGAAPDLVTTIGQPATPFTVGQVSNVPVTVTNQGTAPANGPVTTTITLPTGTSAPALFSSNGFTCSTSGQTVSCFTPGPITNVAPANAITIQVPVTPDISTVGTSPVFNAGTTGTNEPAGNLANNTATPMTPSTPVSGIPDLVTTIGQPATPFVVGQPSNVPVTVTNIGTGAANGPIVTTITLPTGTSAPATFSSNGNTCSTSGQTVTCTNAGPLTNLSPNNSTTIQVPVTPSAAVVGTNPGPFTATSSAPNEPAANTGNNGGTPMTPTTPVSGTPDLVTTIGQPATPFVVGQASNVPVTVTNIGSGPANGPIVTTMILPTGTSAPATFTSNGNTCTTSGQTVTCTNAGSLTNVSPNNAMTIQVPVTPNASTVGTTPTPFSAVSSAPNELPSNTGNNTATPMTPSTSVSGTPDLVTTIGQPATPFVAGSPSNVPVTVTNIGTAPATGPITTIISLPTGTSAPAIFTSNGNTCITNGQTVTCTNAGPLTNVSPNNAMTIQVPVTPTAAVVGTNPGPFTATPTAPNEPPANAGNNGATPMTPTTPVAPAAVVSVKLNVKLFLQGAYDSNTGLMRDDLRTKGFVPTTQPYSAMPRTSYHTGTEATTAAVLSATGSNAIVDWVLLELRTGTTAATRVATRAALVQRDGDVVDVDGISPVTFLNRAAGAYYIVATHRNHLGVMSDVTLALSATATLCDFTLAYDGFGSYAQKDVSGLNLLWAGNANHTGITHKSLIFSGSNNDSDAVKNDVISNNNPAQDFSFVPMGYYLGDTNLDGDVKYQGPANDIDALIFFNVLNHLGNTARSPLFLVNEQH